MSTLAHFHVEIHSVQSNEITRDVFVHSPFPHVLCLCGEADAAALHADLQAVGGFAAGVHDSTVHVTGAVAVVSEVIRATATAARLRCARATGRLCNHHVTQGQELTEQARQDAVHAAVFRKRWFMGAGRTAFAAAAAVTVDRQTGAELPLHLLGHRV